MNRKETHAVMIYSIPPIGTVLPAKSNLDDNGNLIVPNPGPTTQQADFYCWAQAAAQDQAFQQTATAKNGYLNYSFPSWLSQTYPFQPNPELAPPQPPAAFVVVAAAAEAAPVDFQIVPSGMTGTGPYIPVCEVPTYAKIASPAQPGDNKIAEKHGHHKH